MPRYMVEYVRDNPASLQEVLTAVTEGDGRVVSVTWQPDREVRDGLAQMAIKSGYTVVAEYEDD